jgi:hypothetical protein
VAPCSEENVKLALVLLVGSAGADWMAVTGAVPSGGVTVQA